MLGEGMVSFGVIPSGAIEARWSKSAPKIGSSIRTGASTTNPAEVKSRSPPALWKCTSIFSWVRCTPWIR